MNGAGPGRVGAEFVRGAVGSQDPDVAVGVEFDGPAAFVDEAVVVAAEQEAAFELRAAAVDPMIKMVGVAPLGRRTLGERARHQAGVEGFADPVRGDPIGAADIKGQARAGVEDGAPHVGVAGDAAGEFGWDRPDPVQPR